MRNRLVDDVRVEIDNLMNYAVRVIMACHEESRHAVDGRRLCPESSLKVVGSGTRGRTVIRSYRMRLIASPVYEFTNNVNRSDKLDETRTLQQTKCDSDILLQTAEVLQLRETDFRFFGRSRWKK
ncbi:hypothetical protein V9T40_009569 [Parthenolecanium corni]|uniref:Uncharacterized protein n=1 Tax=Parthenolecanium corni TaxID=536013 RepID=A0AAN9TQ81_9HEMI